MKKDDNRYTEKVTVRFKKKHVQAIDKVVKEKRQEFDRYNAADYIRDLTVKDLKKRKLLK